MKYNPTEQSIAALVDQCEDDWGTPEQNKSLLLPFGIEPIDLALYGMNTIDGEVILIQGPQKQRKTTFAVNIVVNYMMSPIPVTKPLTVIDTLESGMTTKRYRDTLLSVVATKLMIKDGHKVREFCPPCGTPTCRAVGITPDFLKFGSKTNTHKLYIEAAKDVLKGWPLQIYGAGSGEGETRNLSAAVGGGQVTERPRWKHLIDEFGAKVFVTDHLQQYSFADGFLSDYEKQIRTVASVSDVVASDHIICLLLSQVSLTSIRDQQQNGGKLTASGGNKAAAESTSIFSVNYESGSGEMCITLEESRKAGAFSVYHKLEDASGAFYGVPTAGPVAALRPGMENEKHGSNKYKKQ